VAVKSIRQLMDPLNNLTKSRSNSSIATQQKVPYDKLLSEYHHSVQVERENVEINRLNRLKGIDEMHEARINKLLMESNKKHERSQRNALKMAEFKKTKFDEGREKEELVLRNHHQYLSKLERESNKYYTKSVKQHKNMWNKYYTESKADLHDYN
jgi:hypothetical protein